METLQEAVRRRREQLIELRRDFHRHPELAYHEERTTRVIADRLAELGVEARLGVGGPTGVVGLLRGSRPGPTLLIRADIDALPVQEQNEVPYRSEHPGLMHACGHDGHTAVVLTVSEILAARSERLPGTVKLVFQPAEEQANGARRMVEAGVMEDPHVDGVLSFHLWNNLPVGKVGVRPDAIFASADEFNLTIRGKGGHGAMPHLAVDPIAVAGYVITALQTVTSREISPFQPAVVTIGSIHGGTAFNVIADEVRLAGTVRSFQEPVRRQMLDRIEAIVRGVAEGMRASSTFELRCGAPPVVNDPRMAAIVRAAASEVVGPDNAFACEPSTTGDDVSEFMNRAPGCYFLVGSANPSRSPTYSHHHPRFDFDEAALPIATETLVRAALKFLEQGFETGKT
ncbi:MAG: amidohydrolase [Chloroflexi bacterium]|nr:amidohydrolase [Chloroflexota bacterium]